MKLQQKQEYLCHITAPNGQYAQKKIIGISGIKSFLRENGVKFPNDDISKLENDSIVLINGYGFTFEIELLIVPSYIEIYGSRFIPIAEYCKKYEYTRKAVYYLMQKNGVRFEKINGLLYIEDKKRRKCERIIQPQR